MKPRMTYYGPLDEIEAEMGPRPFSLWEQVALLNRTMGKERTLKVGDRVKTIDGKVGVIHECSPCDQYWIDFGDGEGYDAYTPWQLQCIPVEPERVKWYYRMSCATRSCAANDEGMCNVSINGLATCSKHQWPKPSPGLLQRMGMATWPSDDEWFVVEYNPQGGDHELRVVSYSSLKAEEELPFWFIRSVGDHQRRAFRWSDGVQG